MTESSEQTAVAVNPPAVAASSTLALIHYLDNLGLLEPARVEEITGASLEQLQDPDRRVAADRHYRLWEYAEQVTGDPAVGLHAGAVVDPERMGLVGHVFFNCDTLGEAVTQYVRLHRLVNESVLLSFEHSEDQAILTWQPDIPGHYCRQDMDRTLAAALSRTRHFIHPQITVDWAEIAHPEPAYGNEYEALLGGPCALAVAAPGSPSPVATSNTRSPPQPLCLFGGPTAGQQPAGTNPDPAFVQPQGPPPDLAANVHRAD